LSPLAWLAKGFQPLGSSTILNLALKKLALVFFPFFSLGHISQNGPVHQSVEVWIDLWGHEGSKLTGQSFYELCLLLGISVDQFWGIARQLSELEDVFTQSFISLLQVAKFISLSAS
jgi:hypothetical protein